MCPQSERQCVSSESVRQCVSSESVRQCVFSESVCVFRVSETVCVLRVSETVCVLRVSETVCVLRDSETVCVKLKLVIEATSWDSNISHQESSSLPLVLLVNNRFRSRGLELFIWFTHVIMSWSCHISLPNATRGRCNLHIDTIPDVLPAVLPAFSSCD